MAVGKLAWPVR